MRRSECWSKPFEYPVEARQHYTSIGKIKIPPPSFCLFAKMPSETGSDGICDFSLAQRFELLQNGGIPGSIPTAPIATHKIKKPTAGINTRPTKPNCALRSLQPIKPKLSNSIVNAQPKTGLTRRKRTPRWRRIGWFCLCASFPCPLPKAVSIRLRSRLRSIPAAKSPSPSDSPTTRR